MCAVFATRAQGLDDQYVQIYNQIQQADGYLRLGQKAQAAILYRFKRRWSGLKRIKAMAPKWNESVISFRLDYVSGASHRRTAPRAAALSTAPGEAQPPLPSWWIGPPRPPRSRNASAPWRPRSPNSPPSSTRPLNSTPPPSTRLTCRKPRRRAAKLQRENDALKAAVDQAKAQSGNSGKASSKEIEAAVEKGRKEGKEKSKKEIANAESRLASANSEIDFLKKQISDLSRNKPGPQSRQRTRPAPRRIESLRAKPGSADRRGTRLASGS